MLRRDVEAAADLLDRILDRIKAGELRAPGRVVARLHGAALGLREAAGRPHKRAKRTKAKPGSAGD